jgi:hypothetical protein
MRDFFSALRLTLRARCPFALRPSRPAMDMGV